MRQLNEYKYFKDFIKIRIVRKNNFKKTHSSDGQLNDCRFDYVIDNNRSLEELYDILDTIIKIERKRDNQ